MRIAFIGQKGIPAVSGGVETHVEELSVRLASLGHEVYVYARPNYTKKELTEFKGVKLVNLPNLKTKHLDAISHTFLACMDVIFRRNVDIVHFHSIGPSSLIWLIKIFKPNTPVIATFHTQCYYHKKWGSMAKLYLKFGEYVCCKLADATITISETLKTYTRNRYKRSAIYIPNGVSLPEKMEPYEINKLDLEKNNYIVTVSRLVRHKGIHYLIDAYNQLDTEMKLVIVGSGSYTDKYVSELKEKADSNPNIIFTGNQTGNMLTELFSNAFMFVQPSESEGLSIALLEAMAYAKPIIASDILENVEALKDTGYYFKNGNALDLRDRMLEIIKNSEIALMKGREARRRVIEFFNWNDIVLAVEKVYLDALNAKSNKPFGFLKKLTRNTTH